MLIHFVFSLLLSTSSAFDGGSYICHKGNNDSICPQKIRQKYEYKTHRLYVIYSGYCNDQGPFIYECSSKDVCGDNQVEFRKNDQGYLWQNKRHSFFCQFIPGPLPPLRTPITF